MTAHAASLRIALVGNPNCGKTALSNLLTGSRQKVANYAGVTVERKEGQLTTPQGRTLSILDLPGTYSLRARSPDEEVTRDVVLGRFANETSPDLLLCVADSTNLRLALRLVLELKSVGRPMVLARVISRCGARISIPGTGVELPIRLRIRSTAVSAITFLSGEIVVTGGLAYRPSSMAS